VLLEIRMEGICFSFRVASSFVSHFGLPQTMEYRWQLYVDVMEGSFRKESCRAGIPWAFMKDRH
jgi:hypothetical protein